MKIIDFSKKGNLVRFYLGKDDCNDYWGDDWDDAPYDCNAEEVYDEYVCAIADVAFDFDSLVLEPCNSYHLNCSYTKEDMIKRNVPCLIIVPEEVHEHSFQDQFDDWVSSDNVAKIYFGDKLDSVPFAAQVSLKFKEDET